MRRPCWEWYFSPRPARFVRTGDTAPGVWIGGGDGPTQNDYRQPREIGSVETLPRTEDSEKLFRLFEEKSTAWGLPEQLRLVDGSGRAVFGAEIRSAAIGQGRVTSICNHLRTACEVRLAGADGKAVTELITGKVLGKEFDVEPMTPLLVQVED